MNNTNENDVDKFKNISVLKTYKLYINGKFPRTESGRYYKINTKNKIVNVSQSSVKDFRNAVEIAVKAQKIWSEREPYNVGQITYRIAEMLEDRKYQFIEELESLGLQKEKAEKEVADTINLIVYYAGWTDKFQQIYSNVNPVKNSFFNFSIAEALGVISVLPPQKSALLGFVASFLPAFVGRNTCIILASEQYPTPAISFAEVLNSSDVPEGTINILTGFNDELIKHLTTHMNINGVIYYGNNKDKIKTIQENAATNIKRTIIRNFDENKLENPYIIFDTLETKTIWQPRII